MLVAATAAVYNADNTRAMLYIIQHERTHTHTHTAPTEIYNELKLYTLQWLM